MPVAHIKVERLREKYIRDCKSLLHSYGPALQARGFCLDQPLDLERTESHLIVKQEVPGRLPLNDSRIYGFLQRIARGDAGAIGSLTATLLAEGDDRAEKIEAISVDMPEDLGDVYADWGQGMSGDSGRVVPSEAIVARER